MHKAQPVEWQLSTLIDWMKGWLQGSNKVTDTWWEPEGKMVEIFLTEYSMYDKCKKKKKYSWLTLD